MYVVRITLSVSDWWIPAPNPRQTSRHDDNDKLPIANDHFQQQQQQKMVINNNKKVEGEREREKETMRINVHKLICKGPLLKVRLFELQCVCKNNK